MASNPLNAFLQGFEAVDRLETNRQNRQFNADQASFLREEQSQTRKMWERKDTEYGRAVFERQQEDYLAKFQATLQDVVNNPGADAAFLGDRDRVYGEVMKTMIAKYEGFGEHLALAGKLDPGAGPLVKNKQKPVTAAYLVSPDRDPAGKGGIVFEVDGVNGSAPYTDNRSANPNDPVTIAQYGMSELVDAFGAEVMTNKYEVSRLIRDAAGIAAPTGNPSEQMDQTAKQPAAKQPAAKQPAAAAATPANRNADGEEIDPKSGKTRSQIDAERDATVAPAQQGREPGTQRFRDQHATDNFGREVPNADDLYGHIYNKEPSERAIYEQSLIEAAGDSNSPASSRVAATARLVYSATVGSFLDFEKEAIGYAVNKGGQSTGWTQDKVDKGAGFLIDVIEETITGKPSKTQGQGVDAKVASIGGKVLDDPAVAQQGSKTTDGPAVNIGDIKSSGANPNDYSADKFSAPSETAGRTLAATPTPGTEEGVKSTAGTLLSAQGKRPSLVNIFNAVGLTKLNVLSPEQLMRYAQTGQFNEAAKRDLQVIQSEGFARIFDKDTGSLSAPFQIAPGEGGDTTRRTVADRKAVRDLTVDTVENTFIDAKTGDVDKRWLQQFMDVQDGVFDIKGIGPNDPDRTEPSTLRSIAAGSRFVSQFNEDDIQWVDLSWGDVEIPHTAGNVALGVVADESGITNQEEANYFLRDYAHTLRKLLNVRADAKVRNDGWLATQVTQAEKFLADARTNKDNPHYDTYGGMSQRDARSAWVKRQGSK